MVLTEPDMFDLCQKEIQSGRIPKTIEFVQATIPDYLADRLHKAKQAASNEVSPAKKAWR